MLSVQCERVGTWDGKRGACSSPLLGSRSVLRVPPHPAPAVLRFVSWVGPVGHALSSFWVEQSQEMFCRSSSSVFKLQIDIQLTGRDQSLGEQTSPPGAQRRCRIPSSSCSALLVPRFCAARWRSSASGARLKAHRWSGSQVEAQG